VTVGKRVDDIVGVVDGLMLIEGLAIATKVRELEGA
jgi:hypothetical protein